MKEVAGGEHVPVLRFAIAGWVTLCAMAVGVAFFPIDSGRGAKPNSEIAPLFNVQSPLPELRSTSCSTSNCHGSLTEDPRESRIRSDEYHVWLNDPHARAFQVLTEERSRKIFQNLGVADQFMNPKKGQVDAFQRHWNNCLGCHDSNPKGSVVSHVTAIRPSGCIGTIDRTGRNRSATPQRPIWALSVVTNYQAGLVSVRRVTWETTMVKSITT